MNYEKYSWEPGMAIEPAWRICFSFKIFMTSSRIEMQRCRISFIVRLHRECKQALVYFCLPLEIERCSVVLCRLK